MFAVPPVHPISKSFMGMEMSSLLSPFVELTYNKAQRFDLVQKYGNFLLPSRFNLFESCCPNSLVEHNRLESRDPNRTSLDAWSSHKTDISTSPKRHPSLSTERRPEAPVCHQEQKRRRGSSDGFGGCSSESSCLQPRVRQLAVWPYGPGANMTARLAC